MADEHSSGDIIKSVNTEFAKLWNALNTELAKRVKTEDQGSSTNQYAAYQTAKEVAHPETQNTNILSNPYAVHILNIVAKSHLKDAAALGEKAVGDIIPSLNAYYTVVNQAAAATESTVNGGCDGACTGYCIGSCSGTEAGATASPGTNSGGCSNCSTVCTTTCKEWCTNQCSGACVSGCQQSCSVNCYQNCDEECATSCGPTGCFTSCTGGCGSGCIGGCGSGCTGACYSACTGGVGI